jgi:hypothetical protein
MNLKTGLISLLNLKRAFSYKAGRSLYNNTKTSGACFSHGLQALYKIRAFLLKRSLYYRSQKNGSIGPKGL